MQYLPLFADLSGRPCAVIGGGPVAARKVRLLRRAAARVTVYADSICDELAELIGRGDIARGSLPLSDADIERASLVIAATSDRALNKNIAARAERAGRLCNVVDDAELSTAIMPAIIDRNPVIVAFSTGGSSPAFARWLRQLIELALPTGTDRLAAWANRQRHRIRTRIGNAHRRLHVWQDIFDGSIADLVRSGDSAAADRALDAVLTSHNQHAAPTGVAWLVGAGPGDPSLVTRRGLECVQRADSILFDRLASPALLDYARRDAEFVDVGKTPGGPSVPQSDINRLLVERVRAGQRVCRLKGGDPMIFGRGGEEISALAEAGLAWQVIPGITAAQGVSAATGIPLTDRRAADGVSLITGHRRASANELTGEDWERLGSSDQTLVFYMAVGQLRMICAALLRGGRSPNTPAAIMENATLPQQRYIGDTLATLPDTAEAEKISPPAILIVGDVIALAPSNASFDSRAAIGQ